MYAEINVRCDSCGQIVGFGEHVCPEYESVAVRFWSKVEFSDSCWLWRNGTRNGYGAFSLHHGVSRYAHRWAYEFCGGVIPDGYELDHLCRVPLCVRPEHLEPVTKTVNVLRGVGASALNARKTHCPQGHPYSPDNTYIPPRRNGRRCKACVSARRRDHAITFHGGQS